MKQENLQIMTTSHIAIHFLDYSHFIEFFLSPLNKWKTINNHETYSKSFEENNKKFVGKTVLS